jgi:hypothetical protein
MAAVLAKSGCKTCADMTVIGKTSGINTLAREPLPPACSSRWLALTGQTCAVLTACRKLALMATDIFPRVRRQQPAGATISLPVSVMRGLFANDLLALADAQTGRGTVVVSTEG